MSTMARREKWVELMKQWSREKGCLYSRVSGELFEVAVINSLSKIESGIF